MSVYRTIGPLVLVYSLKQVQALAFDVDVFVKKG